MSKKDKVLEIFINESGKIQIPDSYLDRYLKYRDEEKVLDNTLLGDFVDDKYVISKDIKEELVLRKKILTDWTDDGLRADTNVGSKVFHFELEIKEFDKEKDIAIFYLIEKVYDENLKSFIADYVDDKSLNFKEIAMAAFNILLEDDGKQDEDLNSINKRFESLKNKNNAERKFMTEMYSELYVLRMLKILSNCGPIGKKILEEYSEKIKEKGYTGAPTPDLYIKLRKVLDDTIEKNGGLKEITKQNPQVKVALKEFVDPMDYYKKIAEAPIVAPIKKVPEKASTKKPAAKASSGGGAKKGGKSGGGKSGGGGKPKVDKKDDKKKEVVGTFLPKKKEEKKQENKKEEVINKTSEEKVNNLEKTDQSKVDDILNKINSYSENMQEVFLTGINQEDETREYIGVSETPQSIDEILMYITKVEEKELDVNLSLDKELKSLKKTDDEITFN